MCIELKVCTWCCVLTLSCEVEGISRRAHCSAAMYARTSACGTIRATTERSLSTVPNARPDPD
eukprot:3372126-Rhodomonas_salina.2